MGNISGNIPDLTENQMIII